MLIICGGTISCPGCEQTIFMSVVFFSFAAKKCSVGDTGPKTGYANNFGQPRGGSSTVEAQMIVNMLQPLVTKFVECAKDINNQDNIVSSWLVKN